MAVIDDAMFNQLLLAHLLRCPAVIERASTVLDPDDFNQAGEQTYRLVWALSKDWYAKQRTLIPRPMLDMELRSAIGEGMSMFSSGEVDRLWPLLDGIYSMPDNELAADWALEHLRTFLDERKLRPILQQVASMGAGEDFNKLLDSLKVVQSSNQMTSLTEAQMFHPSRIEIVNYQRHPTGVDPIDVLFDGGTFPGELYGILAPTGGGKTTIGVSLLVESARRKRNAAFFSYEVELVPEISNRVYAVAGNIPRGAFKGLKSFDDLPTAYKASLTTGLEECGPYINAFDMKKDTYKGIGTKGPMEIRNKLRECKQAGRPMDIVVIDQLLSLIDPWIVAEGGKIESRRTFLDMGIEQLRDIAQEMKCAMFILHQVDNVAKKLPPTRVPKQGQAAEMKSFENNMQFAAQFGTQDPLGRSHFALVKHRMSAANSIIVQHDPEYWRINYTPKRFTCGSDGFVDHINENQERQMSSAAEADRGGRKEIKISQDA